MRVPTETFPTVKMFKTARCWFYAGVTIHAHLSSLDHRGRTRKNAHTHTSRAIVKGNVPSDTCNSGGWGRRRAVGDEWPCRMQLLQRNCISWMSSSLPVPAPGLATYASRTAHYVISEALSLWSVTCRMPKLTSTIRIFFIKRHIVFWYRHVSLWVPHIHFETTKSY